MAEKISCVPLPKLLMREITLNTTLMIEMTQRGVCNISEFNLRYQKMRKNQGWRIQKAQCAFESRYYASRRFIR